MIQNITSPSFKARMIFTNKNTIKQKLFSSNSFVNVLHTRKAKEPSGLLKFIFGIKKKTKLPTYKGQK